MPFPRSTSAGVAVVTAATIAGIVAAFASLAVAGLTGIPVPLFLVSGPAALVIRFEQPPTALIFLFCGGLAYGLYAFLLCRFGRRAIVWLIVLHGLGAALAAATVGP